MALHTNYAFTWLSWQTSCHWNGTIWYAVLRSIAGTKFVSQCEAWFTYVTPYYTGPVPLHCQERSWAGRQRVYVDGEIRCQAGHPAWCRRPGRTAAQWGDAHHPDGRRPARHARSGGTEDCHWSRGDVVFIVSFARGQQQKLRKTRCVQATK